MEKRPTSAMIHRPVYEIMALDWESVLLGGWVAAQMEPLSNVIVSEM